jgi:hypothetical protein
MEVEEDCWNFTCAETHVKESVIAVKVQDHRIWSMQSNPMNGLHHSQLRHCAKSRKVAGSIPYGFLGVCH